MRAHGWWKVELYSEGGRLISSGTCLLLIQHPLPHSTVRTEHDSDPRTGMERHTEVFHGWTERVVQRKDSQICMGSGLRGSGGGRAGG